MDSFSFSHVFIRIMLYFRHNGLAEIAVVAIENLEYISRHTLNAALSMVCASFHDTSLKVQGVPKTLFDV